MTRLQCTQADRRIGRREAPNGWRWTFTYAAVGDHEEEARSKLIWVVIGFLLGLGGSGEPNFSRACCGVRNGWEGKGKTSLGRQFHMESWGNCGLMNCLIEVHTGSSSWQMCLCICVPLPRLWRSSSRPWNWRRAASTWVWAGWVSLPHRK